MRYEERIESSETHIDEKLELTEIVGTTHLYLQCKMLLVFKFFLRKCAEEADAAFDDGKNETEENS